LKFTTHVPAPVNVTFPAEIVQPEEVESSVIATLSDEVAVALAA
jgi:hypothetical protein